GDHFREVGERRRAADGLAGAVQDHRPAVGVEGAAGVVPVAGDGQQQVVDQLDRAGPGVVEGADDLPAAIQVVRDAVGGGEDQVRRALEVARVRGEVAG